MCDEQKPGSQRHRPSRRAQRGISLVEALIAFLVMGVGLLATLGVQTMLRFNSDIARQRSEAVRLAQAELERLRAFSSITAAPGLPSYDDIVADAEHELAGPTSNTVYRLTRTVAEATDPGFKSASVSIRWPDRQSSAAAPAVVLHSVIAGVDPALSGLLVVPAPAAATVQPLGRNMAIPRSAGDLGDGRSVYKPADDGTLAWVFDNGSGVITSRCRVSITARNASLTAADLSACEASQGHRLSGVVRFATAGPVSADEAEHPHSPAMPLDMSLALDSADYPSPAYECFDDAPASVGAQTTVSYQCAVYPPRSSTLWSGRLSIAPVGWIFDSTAAAYRLCRYSADHDASGAIENDEHPAHYTGVAGFLSQQNFLVIRGDFTCPADAPVDPAALAGVDHSTLQHEP